MTPNTHSYRVTSITNQQFVSFNYCVDEHTGTHTYTQTKTIYCINGLQKLGTTLQSANAMWHKICLTTLDASPWHISISMCMVLKAKNSFVCQTALCIYIVLNSAIVYENHQGYWTVDSGSVVGRNWDTKFLQQTAGFVGLLHLLGFAYTTGRQYSELQFREWISDVVWSMVQQPSHEHEQLFDFHCTYCPVPRVLRKIGVILHAHQKYCGRMLPSWLKASS